METTLNTKKKKEKKGAWNLNRRTLSSCSVGLPLARTSLKEIAPSKGVQKKKTGTGTPYRMGAFFVIVIQIPNRADRSFS